MKGAARRPLCFQPARHPEERAAGAPRRVSDSQVLRGPCAKAHGHLRTTASEKLAGRKRRLEEATRTASGPAEPHGPRRCGGPELLRRVFRWLGSEQPARAIAAGPEPTYEG